MEGAGKLVEDDELREAMQEKGLGTPATRAAIIEGLINEKYMLREGREMIPTAKAFQLMTLLRGLGVEELSKPELTGEWEYKLAQMEHGKLSRDAFMREIAEMTEAHRQEGQGIRPRHRARRLRHAAARPAPTAAAWSRKTTAATPAPASPAGEDACGFSFGKTPAGRTFESGRGGAVPARQEDRPAGRLPLQGGLAVHRRDRAQVQRRRQELEARIRLRRRQARPRRPARSWTSARSKRWAPAPNAAARVFEHGKNYVCEKSVPTAAQPTPSCDFKTGQVILQQPVMREQMTKLLETGKTDLLDKFVSMRTRRAFKAFLAWDAEAGKVNFEFAPSKFPPRKTAAARQAVAAKEPAAREKPAAKKRPPKRPCREESAAAKKAAPPKKQPRPKSRAPPAPA
jgi:DNA topoisomerase-3